MSLSSATALPAEPLTKGEPGAWRILSFVYFTFVCYVSIGLPLAVLPPYVHYRMGYSAALAGLAVSTLQRWRAGPGPGASAITPARRFRFCGGWGCARRAERCC